MTDTLGISSESKRTAIHCLSLPSAVTPAPYSDELPVPKPQNTSTVDKERSDADEVRLDQVEEGTDSDSTFGQNGPSSQPIS